MEAHFICPQCSRIFTKFIELGIATIQEKIVIKEEVSESTCEICQKELQQCIIFIIK